MGIKEKARKIDEAVYEVPIGAKPGMRVPARLYLSDKLFQQVEDGAVEQIVNVATLPGIYKYSIALPDMHFGYGFCVGGVAAFDYEEGIISPGGIGFDINCGVRVLRTNLTYEEIKNKVKDLLDEIFRNVPAGVGETGKVKLTISQLDEVLEYGAHWAVKNGYGFEKDLEFIESNGKIPFADASAVSEYAKKRGAPQLGTLGSGNHFLEIQVVNRIFLPEEAKVMGIEKVGQIMVMVHTGSRGLGHQVASDYIRILENKYRDILKQLPDRELIYAPAKSKEAEQYLKAMSAAANFAFANRQMITHWVRESFVKVLNMKLEDIGLEIVYDVAHNIAKVEEYEINGKRVKVYVHRKGATRAFPIGSKEIPKKYQSIGQPVLVPGSMGTFSYILLPAERAIDTFFSAPHGSGRVQSRAAAVRSESPQSVIKRLEEKGIYLRAASFREVAEERPEAYKYSTDVIEAAEKAKIAKAVVELRPIAVMKG